MTYKPCLKCLNSRTGDCHRCDTSVVAKHECSICNGRAGAYEFNHRGLVQSQRSHVVRTADGFLRRVGEPEPRKGRTLPRAA